MDEKDKLGFSEVMIGLAENFSAQMTKPGLLLRFNALSAHTLEQVKKAAVSLIMQRERMGMPTVAEIIKEIEGPAKNPADMAALQVADILKQIRELGSYRTPSFVDPVTKAIMSSRWSWRAVCAMTEAELKWWAKEFIEAYQAMDRVDTREKIAHSGTPMDSLKKLTAGIGG